VKIVNGDNLDIFIHFILFYFIIIFYLLLLFFSN